MSFLGPLANVNMTISDNNIASTLNFQNLVTARLLRKEKSLVCTEVFKGEEGHDVCNLLSKCLMSATYSQSVLGEKCVNIYGERERERQSRCRKRLTGESRIVGLFSQLLCRFEFFFKIKSLKEIHQKLFAGLEAAKMPEVSPEQENWAQFNLESFLQQR